MLTMSMREAERLKVVQGRQARMDFRLRVASGAE